MQQAQKLGILVGGGPAPGINAVVGAATIRGALEGVPVLGIQDGFEWIMRGDSSRVSTLTIEDVSRIHFQGGSHIGISRANPTSDPKHLAQALASLLRLGVTQLITIGGDDTAYSALKLEQLAAGRIRVVHVPKTIDNDLALPSHVDTCGYQTARHVGVEIVKNLMVDAKTTSRWYFVVTMGRQAGHLALGIGKAAGATLTLIPEEFNGAGVSMRAVVDTLVGAIVKRLAYGRRDGVAVVAEALARDLAREDGEGAARGGRNEYGRLRMAEIDLGEALRKRAQERLRGFGIDAVILAKDIGYELRCADPIPHDMELTRDLGYCAAKYLFSGGNAVVVAMDAGQFRPIPFRDLLDPETGRVRIRLVDVRSTRYAIARRYMIRLRRDDFEDEQDLARYAAVCGLSVQEFRAEFEDLVATEQPALSLGLVPSS